jgi:short-subunit dehydrogenase
MGTWAWTLHRNFKNAATFPNKTQICNIGAHAAQQLTAPLYPASKACLFSDGERLKEELQA